MTAGDQEIQSVTHLPSPKSRYITYSANTPLLFAEDTPHPSPRRHPPAARRHDTLCHLSARTDANVSDSCETAGATGAFDSRLSIAQWIKLYPFPPSGEQTDGLFAHSKDRASNGR